jgi:hypothetical protein
MKTSQQPSSTDRIPLESLLRFLNFQIEPLHDINLMAAALEYARFAVPHRLVGDALLPQKVRPMIDWLLSTTNTADDADRKKQLMINLQQHLSAKIKSIIELSQSGNQLQEQVFLEVLGTRKVFIDAVNDRFFEGFVPGDLKEKDIEGVGNELHLADAAFISLVQQLHLRPKSFGICARTKCGNFFYQQTKMMKRFCSDRCASADRQEKFQSKKRAEKPQKKKRQ